MSLCQYQVPLEWKRYEMKKIINIINLTLCLVFAFASAKALAEIPLSAYGKIPDTSLMTISPSGKYIGFRKASGSKDVYMVFSLAENKVIASVNVDDAKPSKAYFVKDDQIILVVGKYQQTHGFYSSSPQHTTYALGFNLSTKKVYRLLTPGKGIYDNQWGLGDISGISSDGDYVYMPAYVGGLAMDDWQGLNKNLMQTRLSGSRKPRAFAVGTEETRDYFVDDKDNLLARVEYDNKTDIFTIQKRDGKGWVNIYQKTHEIPFEIQGVTPDKKHLLLAKYATQIQSNISQGKVAITLDRSGATKETNTSPSAKQASSKSQSVAYFTMSLANGEISEKPVFAKQNASIETPIQDINRVVYGVKYSGFIPKYEFFDDSITKRLDNITKSFANTAVHLKDWSEDWKHLLVYIEGQESSGEYIIVNEKGEMNIVGMARPAIPYSQVHPISIVNYRTADGLKIPALVTKPKSWDGKSKLPTIMLPHGGPASYDKIGFDWMAQSFAEQGYLVVQPQFRGSDGFGLAHKQAGYGEWGKKMQSDLTDALQVLIAKGYTDPERVCIVGASYGGYAALAAGAFSPNLYKCVVSINGVSDLEQMLAQKEKQFGKDHWVLSYWNKSLSNEKNKSYLFKEISPINYSNKFSAPVLLIHAENDSTVSYSQSEKMHKALKKHNKDSRLVELSKDDHFLSYSDTRMQTLTEVTSFLKQHL